MFAAREARGTWRFRFGILRLGGMRLLFVCFWPGGEFKLGEREREREDNSIMVYLKIPSGEHINKAQNIDEEFNNI